MNSAKNTKLNDLVPAFGSVFGSALGGKCKFPGFLRHESSPSDGGFTKQEPFGAKFHPMLMIEP
jgi:hypothetical protein